MEISGFVRTSLEQLKSRVDVIKNAAIDYNKKMDEVYEREIKLQTDAYNKSKILGLFKRKQLTTKEYEKYL